MKVTKRELELFHNNANAILSQKKDLESKFLFALKKVKKKTTNLYEDYIDQVQEARIDHASVDEKGNLISVNGQYQFTPEKLKAFTKKVRSLEKEQVEIEPHFVSTFPDDLPKEFEEVLINFVLQEKEETEA